MGLNVSHFVCSWPSFSFSLVSFGGFSALAVIADAGRAGGSAPTGRVPIRPVIQSESGWNFAASATPR